MSGSHSSGAGTFVRFFEPAIDESDVERVVETLRSGWLTSGRRVAELESAFAELTGCTHAVATSSGTDAIHVALSALGVGRGDVVLVPTLTFVGTADPIRWLGARPVLVDCDPRHLGASLGALRETLGAIDRGEPVPGSLPPHGTVRAILPVHYGGLVGETTPLAELAARRGLDVVDDCAHAVTADALAPDGQWRHAGSTFRAGCFSFYANKAVTTGEGGMVVTNDGPLAAHLRRLALHGIERPPEGAADRHGPSDYRVVSDGLKCNLSDVAAALGIGQVARARATRDARAAIARRYREGLAGSNAFELPDEPPDRRHAWHLFAIRLREDAWRIGRDRLARELRARGVETSVHYRPLHVQPAFSSKPEYAGARFTHADTIWPRLMSLPIYPAMAPETVDFVIDTLLSASREFAA